MASTYISYGTREGDKTMPTSPFLWNATRQSVDNRDDRPDCDDEFGELVETLGGDRHGTDRLRPFCPPFVAVPVKGQTPPPLASDRGLTDRRGTIHDLRDPAHRSNTVGG